MMRFFLTLISLLFLFSIGVFAQPGNPPPEVNRVPISGIEILLVAGSLLGLKKIWRSGNKTTDIK